MKKTLLTAVMLAALNAGAAESPHPTKFWTTRRIVTQAISFTGASLDIGATKHAQAIPGTRELDPLARSTAGLVAVRLGLAGVGLAAAYGLYRTGHYKASVVVPALIGAGSFAAVIHNSRMTAKK